MIATLNKQGFFIYKDALISSEIDELKLNTKNLLSTQDKDIIRAENDNIAYKILYPLAKHSVYLKYLVHQKVLEILLNYFDNPTSVIPVWEDVMIKEAYNGKEVKVHQDVDYNIKTTWDDMISIGINMHRSEHCPIYYLPGSHNLGILAPEQINTIFIDRVKEFIPTFVNAGDISIHLPQTLHYSNSNKSTDERYTLYYVFRDMNIMRKYHVAKDKWLYSKQAIFSHALKTYQPTYHDIFISNQSLLDPYSADLKLRVPYKEDVTEFSTETIFEG